MADRSVERGELVPFAHSADSAGAPVPVEKPQAFASVAVADRTDFAQLAPNYEYRFRQYLMRFAATSRDIDAVCRLRYDVFNVELGEGLESSAATGLDRDEYDDQCQHLMVIDTKNNTVVGTYRLQVLESAEAGLGFYSASEFDLSAMSSEMQRSTVELGRACTDIKHRSRTVLNLLWRGIMTYLHHNRRRYLFGCSSLTSQDPALGLDTHRYLGAHGYTHPTLDIQPLPGYVCQASQPSMTRVKIPPLFALYLRYGVKVCSAPAIDREFGTIDYLTMLDTGSMDPSVLKTFTN